MSTKPPVPAGVTRLYWFNTIAAAVMWPLGIWLAVTRDWTDIAGPVMITGMVGMSWIAYRTVARRRLALDEEER